MALRKWMPAHSRAPATSFSASEMLVQLRISCPVGSPSAEPNVTASSPVALRIAWAMAPDPMVWPAG